MDSSTTILPAVPPPAKRSRAYIPQIVGIAALLRLTIVVVTAATQPPGWFFGQASELGELAQSLRLGHGLSSPFGGATGPSAFLAPGYPAFVACIFRMFGSYSMAAAVVLMTLQAILGALTVLVTMLLARRLASNTAANVAGIIWAVSPPVLFLPIVFWETSASVLLLTTIATLSLVASAQPTLRFWLGLGLCSLLALAINPSLATAIVGCFAWAVWKVAQSTSRTKPLMIALVVMALFSLWPARNLRVMHAFIPLRDNLGYELWQGNRAGSDGFFLASLHPNTNMDEFHRYQSLGELGYMQEKSTLAKAAIRDNPARFVNLTLKRIVCFWTGAGRQSTWLMTAYVSTTSFFGLAGLVLMLRRKNRLAPLLAIPLLLLPLPYYLTHPDYRFRCVIDPLLTVLTAYAILHWNKPILVAEDK